MTAWSGHWEYEGVVLSQDLRDGEAFPLLAAIPRRRSPRPKPGRGRSTLMRYERSSILRGPRALSLEPHHARLTLWNENPGRAPLLRLLRRRHVTSFLRLAISAAMRLARVHQRGLIFRYIKPANIPASSAGARRSHSRREMMPRPINRACPVTAGAAIRKLTYRVHPAPLFTVNVGEHPDIHHLRRLPLLGDETDRNPVSSATASSLVAAPYLAVLPKRDCSRKWRSRGKQ